MVLEVILQCIIFAAIATGARQLYRFRGLQVDFSTRLVVCLEMLSQAFFSVRCLNGPGYEHGWQSIIPHWCARLTISLFHDLHMLAMFLVALQLRHTMAQLNKRKISLPPAVRLEDSSNVATVCC